MVLFCFKKVVEFPEKKGKKKTFVCENEQELLADLVKISVLW